MGGRKDALLLCLKPLKAFIILDFFSISADSSCWHFQKQLYSPCGDTSNNVKAEEHLKKSAGVAPWARPDPSSQQQQSVSTGSRLHTAPLALMSLPTACSVRQAQLTSLCVSTVFHKWQCAKISRGNEGSRVNKRAALLSVHSGCISVFVEGCIGLLCVCLLCTNTKLIGKGKQMSSAAKIFFPLFSITFGTIIFYYTVCKVTSSWTRGRRRRLIKNRIVMGTELGEREGKKPNAFQVFQANAFQCPCQTGKWLLMCTVCGRGTMARD